MAISPSQTNGPRETLETSESDMTQIRQEIGLIADRSYRDKLISDEAYDGYRKLADGMEEHGIGAEMLESTREFAKGHERKAIRINQKIQSAIKNGIASKADEEFLMEKLVSDNIQFADKSEEVERLIDQKLTRMKKERETYDKLAGHALIKDIGCLKVDGNTRIDFPNAEEFLKLTVPERRELLKKLEEALPKAEKYAKENESAEDKELTAGYEGRLKEALKKGIIGKQTYDEFLNGFKKIDHEEKKYWNKEFDAQMERYETLWGQIRGSLEGEALESIESKIDSSGYTELFAEFGKLKNSENKRLNESYSGELEKFRKDGIIGRHTAAQFVLWMNQQELPDKYKAEQKLPNQMARYEKLWQNVEDLHEKQQDFMRSKIDVWGYTELNQQYNKYIGADGAQEEGSDSDRDSLSQLKSTEVRNAIAETDEMLAGQGKSKRKNFISILDKMFSKVGRDKFDEKRFKDQIGEQVANDNREKPITKGREANDEVDFSQIEKDTKILRKRGAKVTKNRGFVQVESKEGDKTARKAQVTVNKEDSMKRFFTEDGKHNYRSEEIGGNDNLSLDIETDGRTVELDLQEIQALHKHLKKREKQERLDEAA